jgi:hypothetical protein
MVGVTRSLNRFSVVSHPGVSVFRHFCDTKTPGWQNLVFWTQNQQRTHPKVGTTRPPKAIHTAIYAEGVCPYTHRATDNRHTECGGWSRWSFGSRRARIVCKGSPIRFVPEAYGTKDRNYAGLVGKTNRKVRPFIRYALTYTARRGIRFKNARSSPRPSRKFDCKFEAPFSTSNA